MKLTRTLKIHPGDNVAVALTDLVQGDLVSVDETKIVLNHAVPLKHKFALTDIDKGQQILMYGTLVGKALTAIRKGDSISTANTSHEAGDYAFTKVKTLQWVRPDVSEFRDAHFFGYRRNDGRVGTANHWIVIPLVFCENRNVEFMRDAFRDELGYGKGNEYKQQLRTLINSWKGLIDGDTISQHRRGRVFENIDGVKFLTHQLGCGATPYDARMLCGLIAGYINHPNVAGATVLSLGCQDAQISILMDEIERRNPAFDKPLVVLEQQKSGTEKKLLTSAIDQTFSHLAEVNKQKREPSSLSELTIGVECGGSDGFSGLSANPAIGFAADLTVALGGKVILSEFPELCGVEQQLIERCVDRETAERFIRIQRDYAARAQAVGAGFHMNPSPGNIKDGLITDAMKSAGAVKKGGTSPVVDVLDYPEPVTKPGLSLLCTPGSDVESTTALVGSGANLVLFSTGLGTPTGNPVAPVVKISSNTKVADRMHDIIDIDAGKIISGEESIEEAGRRILRYCVDVASGVVETKAVSNNQDDFIPWKRGISL